MNTQRRNGNSDRFNRPGHRPELELKWFCQI
jgi:hypothetical protein